jgi:hypothetical protein
LETDLNSIEAISHSRLTAVDHPSFMPSPRHLGAAWTRSGRQQG